jgi:hypothetical protein
MEPIDAQQPAANSGTTEKAYEPPTAETTENTPPQCSF